MQVNNFAVKMLFSTLTVLILIKIKGAKLEAITLMRRFCDHSQFSEALTGFTPFQGCET